MKIQRMIQRRYSDTGQVSLIICWEDGSTTSCDAKKALKNTHMQALISHGHALGLNIVSETF
jgi:hypothetical protein